MIRLRTPFLAAALFTGVAAAGLAPALAQTAPGPANSTAAPNEARHHAMARMMPGQFVDGRMAVDNPPLSDGTASIFNSAPPYPASLDCKASTAASI